MPVYEYIEVESGETVEFVVPISLRDSVPRHKRVAVPKRINLVMGTPDPTGPDSAVPRALRELEETKNHREIAKETGFSTEEMKTIWNIK